MKKINAITNKVSAGIVYISNVCILIMCAITVLDVALRKIVGKGITGTYEVMQFGMCLAIFAALAYTESTHGHVQITMFLKKFPGKSRYVVLAIGNILSAGMCAVWTYAIFKQAIKIMEKGQISSSLGFPMYPIYFLSAVLALAFCITLIVSAIRSVQALFDEETAQEIEATWV